MFHLNVFSLTNTSRTGSEDKLYTYTIITTSSNSYLSFLHERMPVILEPGSEATGVWLDPKRSTWSKELQAMLKPYEGELECYPVSKEVGKVGNNSPDFIVPVNSKDNKSNIANFFSNAQKKEKPNDVSNVSPKKETVIKSGNINDQAITERGIKRENDSPSTDENNKKQKMDQSTIPPTPPKRKTRSATHNTPNKKSATTKPADGSQRITNFFK